ncbi:MAG: UTP--glucose-1-phosphate uridylyltransferase GalU [Acidimicrobiia bacterium]
MRKAIFPVGGLGTRFLPATKALPKEMLPVVDKPLIEYAVDEARAAGIEEMIFVTGRGKSAIQDHFDSHYELEATLSARGRSDALDAINQAARPGDIAFVRQMEPLGLGHAVWCARNLVRDEPFAVLLADDLILSDRPTLADMIDVYEDTGGNVVSLMEVPPEQTSRYGVVEPGEDDGRLVEVLALVEKPKPEEAPSNLAIVGRYILQPELMDYLAVGTVGAGSEIQLTDSMAKLIGETPFHGLRLSGTRFDCGTKPGFLEANLAFALRRDDLGDDLRERLGRVLDEF